MDKCNVIVLPFLDIGKVPKRPRCHKPSGEASSTVAADRCFESLDLAMIMPKLGEESDCDTRGAKTQNCMNVLLQSGLKCCRVQSVLPKSKPLLVVKVLEAAETGAA